MGINSYNNYNRHMITRAESYSGASSSNSSLTGDNKNEIVKPLNQLSTYSESSYFEYLNSLRKYEPVPTQEYIDSEVDAVDFEIDNSAEIDAYQKIIKNCESIREDLEGDLKVAIEQRGTFTDMSLFGGTAADGFIAFLCNCNKTDGYYDKDPDGNYIINDEDFERDKEILLYYGVETDVDLTKEEYNKKVKNGFYKQKLINMLNNHCDGYYLDYMSRINFDTIVSQILKEYVFYWYGEDWAQNYFNSYKLTISDVESPLYDLVSDLNDGIYIINGSFYCDSLNLLKINSNIFPEFSFPPPKEEVDSNGYRNHYNKLITLAYMDEYNSYTGPDKDKYIIEKIRNDMGINDGDSPEEERAKEKNFLTEVMRKAESYFLIKMFDSENLSIKDFKIPSYSEVSDELNELLLDFYFNYYFTIDQDYKIEYWRSYEEEVIDIVVRATNKVNNANLIYYDGFFSGLSIDSGDVHITKATDALGIMGSGDYGINGIVFDAMLGGREEKIQLDIDAINGYITSASNRIIELMVEELINSEEFREFDFSEYESSTSMYMIMSDQSEYWDIMNDNEKKIFCYLYNNSDLYLLRDGKKYSGYSEYFRINEELWNERIGMKRAQGFIAGLDMLNKNEVMSVLLSYLSVHGIVLKASTDGVINFGHGLENLFFSDGIVSEKDYEIMYIIALLKEKYPDMFYASLYEIFMSIGNMAIPMAVSIITKSPTLGNILMGLSCGGNAYEGALQEGVSPHVAKQYAYLIAMSETLLGEALGGIPGMSRLSNFDGFQALIKKGSNGIIVNNVIKAALGIPLEGVEESLQSIIEQGLGCLFFDEQGIDWEEVKKSGIYGMITAGLLNGGTMIVNNTKIVMNKDKIDAAVNLGKQAEELGIMIDYSQIFEESYLTYLDGMIKEKKSYDNVNFDFSGLPSDTGAVVHEESSSSLESYETKQKIENDTGAELMIDISSVLDNPTIAKNKEEFIELGEDLGYSETALNSFYNQLVSDNVYDFSAKSVLSSILEDGSGATCKKYCDMSLDDFLTDYPSMDNQIEFLKGNSKFLEKSKSDASVDFKEKMGVASNFLKLTKYLFDAGYFKADVKLDDIITYKLNAKDYDNPKYISSKIWEGNLSEYAEYFPCFDSFISDRGAYLYTMKLLSWSNVGLTEYDLLTFAKENNIVLDLKNDTQKLEVLGMYLKKCKDNGNPAKITGMIFQNASPYAKNFVVFSGNLGNLSQVYDYIDSSGNKVTGALTPVYDKDGNILHYVEKEGETVITCDKIIKNYNISGGAYMMLSSPQELVSKHSDLCGFDSSGNFIIKPGKYKEFGEKVLGGVSLDDVNGVYMFNCEVELNSSNVSMPSVNNGAMYTAYGVPGGHLLNDVEHGIMGELETVISGTIINKMLTYKDTIGNIGEVRFNGKTIKGTKLK